jgi:5-methylcytosine-specific restriction enzyme A
LIVRLCPRCGRRKADAKTGPCPDCNRKRNRERRLYEPNHRAYHSARWQQLRRVVRARHDNRCAYENNECRGTLAVHHIVPANADSERFFDLSNLELVCRAHHEKREREARAVFFNRQHAPTAPRFSRVKLRKRRKHAGLRPV